MNENSTWKSSPVPRGNCHNKTETKTTVSLYLNRILVERARKHRLNLSRITEQALTSILDYLETQNLQTSSSASSDFLSPGSFLKESGVPRAGFEPATTRSSASPSNMEVLSRALSQAELPRQSWQFKRETNVLLRFLNSSVEKVGASFIFHVVEVGEGR
jgi:post-segregation antitoxin (ccd killing protein)